jgi:protein-tyrosine-phosphatase
MPEVVDLLTRSGFDVETVRSKGWNDFAGPDAPALDFVFTLCDEAAGETCPVWPGQPMTAHWPFQDPAKLEGSVAERRAAIADIFRQINTRLSIFINLPLDTLDRMSLQRRLDELGKAPVETDTSR